ncbi:hypothetical protein SCHPADRAFT_911536 [Schizopora paradoxa]|uniref:Uncharacterized protein n=1 Tax=Schizopora paradoxa TaxID=27342 RepID=A0A0H2R064_9AGAM|nr:hypothetical protein SCHPADRAFT_911536 [Schizopora paradoxa]
MAPTTIPPREGLRATTNHRGSSCTARVANDAPIAKTRTRQGRAPPRDVDARCISIILVELVESGLGSAWGWDFGDLANRTFGTAYVLNVVRLPRAR